MTFWMFHFFYKWPGIFGSGVFGFPSVADHGATYPVAYDYDDFGRMTALHTWRELVSSYTSNPLNQYTQRTVPGYASVRGVSYPGTLVTVNDNPATQVPPFFHGGVDVDNTQSPVLQPLTITAALPEESGGSIPAADLFTTETGSLFVPHDPELFTYDDDGNLLTDGRFTYTWDAENRLIRVETLPFDIQEVDITPVRVDYAYDHQGRMILKQISDPSVPSLMSFKLYTWDDWNIIRENTSMTNETVITHNTWGLDLSGSLQDAGGAGGLLAVIKDSYAYIPTYDANGNIMAYADDSGTIIAQYEYDPFGNKIIQINELVESFTHNFSTKHFCTITGIIHYQLRPNSTPLGRWMSRDPIVKFHGTHLYNFLNNNGINDVDLLGLISLRLRPPATPEKCNWLAVHMAIGAVGAGPTSYNLWIRWLEGLGGEKELAMGDFDPFGTCRLSAKAEVAKLLKNNLYKDLACGGTKKLDKNSISPKACISPNFMITRYQLSADYEGNVKKDCLFGCARITTDGTINYTAKDRVDFNFGDTFVLPPFVVDDELIRTYP